MLWCETLRIWANWMLRWLGYLCPWIFKVKLYLGNRRPDCYGTKGTSVDRMPWCEKLRKELTGGCADWGTFDLDLWSWIFKVKLYLGNGRPDCHGMNGKKQLRGESKGSSAEWGIFDLYFWLWIFKVKLYLGNGRPDCHGMKGTGVNSIHGLV